MAVLHAALWVLAGCVCLSRADRGLYSLSAVDINGNDVQMEEYRGKVMHNWIAFSFSWLFFCIVCLLYKLPLRPNFIFSWGVFLQA